MLTKQHTPIFTGSRSSYYRHIRPSISRRISNSSKFRKEIVLSLRKLARVLTQVLKSIQPLVAFSLIIAFITIGSSFLDSIVGFSKEIE